MNDPMTILFWFASIMSLVGAWLVADTKTAKRGFLCWMISNPILAFSSWTTGSNYTVVMFSIFWILAIKGFIKW